MPENLDLHSWEGWTVALLGAAMYLAPLRARWAAWRDSAGIQLVAGVLAVSVAARRSVDGVDSAAIEAMGGLGAARIIVEGRRMAWTVSERRKARAREAKR